MRSRPLLALAAAASLVVGASVAASSAQAATPPGLHVSGTQLVEADGTPFVARGVSHAHTWFTSQTPTAIPAIRAAGANALRVVLSDGHRWSKNDAADVANIISLCKANELICMLEDHDTTGYGEEGAASSLDTAASYWIGLKEVLVGQEDYVQINIGNEPFGNNDTANLKWASDTSAAIQRLRAAGLHHNIVVDAPAWGQDWKNVMRDSAQTVAAADPDDNVLFSIHMYGVYNNASTITSYLDAFAAKGLPLIIGEFGYRASAADVDDATVMAEAVARDIGYYGWSWSGNTDPILDMVLGFDPAHLSPWGQRVLNGPNGIKATAVTASVYDGTHPTPDPSEEPTEEPTSEPTEEPTSEPSEEPTDEPTSEPTDEPTGQPTGSCAAELRIVNAWPGGFQGAVVVTAGTNPLTHWTTAFTLPGGATVAQGWSGDFSGTSTVTVTNAAWNGTLGAGQSTEYGFIGTGTAPATAPAVTCS